MGATESDTPWAVGLRNKILMGYRVYFCFYKVTLNTRLVRKAGEILRIVHNYENERIRSKVFSVGKLS